MSANLPILWADKKNSPLLADLIAKYGAEYCMTAEEMNQLKNAVNEMALIQQSTFLGAAEPTSMPAGTGNRYWSAIVPGTYTNYGGVVVNENSLAFISVTAAGAFSISQTPIVIPDTKIKPFINQAYATVDTQVTSLGKLWTNNAPTSIGEIPSTSSKWVEVLTYTNKEEIVDLFENNIVIKSSQIDWEAGFYLNTSGLKLTFADFSYSKNYIPVIPLKQYRLQTSGIAVIFYDKSLNVVGSFGLAGDTPLLLRVLTVPSNAYFMRINQNNATKANLVVYYYSDLLIPNLKISKNQIIDEVEVNEIEKTVASLESNIVSKFSDNQWTTGFYLNESGAKLVFADFSYTENYIKINPLRNYSLPTAGIAVVYYDINKVFISSAGDAFDTYMTRIFTTPTNAHYMRVNQQNVQKENFILKIVSTYNFPKLTINKSQISDLDVNQNATELSVQTVRDISASIDFNTYLIQGNVLVSGDSTIASYAGGTAIADIIKASGTITNIAVPGHTIDQQKADYIALPAGVKTALNYVFVQIGLNDLTPAESALTAISRLQVYINQIKTSSPSAKIIICEMLPCRQRFVNIYGSTDGFVSYQKWQKMNFLISQKGILNTNMVANLHTYNLSDGNGNLANIYDTGDGIHENTAGRKLIAYSWISAYLSL